VADAPADVGKAFSAIRERLGRPALERKTDSRSFPGLGAVTPAELIVSRSIRASHHDDVYVDRWLHDRLTRTSLNTHQIPLRDVALWHVEDSTGNIVHESGRFFTITGLQVRHRLQNEELIWDQPIIDQPEFGVLGILASRIGDILHFCLRLKEEPGNINAVQLSPTVQATYSNYMQSHGGSRPPLIEMFMDPPADRIIISKLQSEDGGRFLFKSNRNMIVLADEDTLPRLPDDFIWLTLRQIANLLKRDNLVNACTRSILGCLI
jgi:oxidase EvaA